jgi:hypothetical protein
VKGQLKSMDKQEGNAEKSTKQSAIPIQTPQERGHQSCNHKVNKVALVTCQPSPQKKPTVLISLKSRGYIVTFTKILIIYHSSIHPFHHSPLSSSFHFYNSFNRSHFSIYKHMYTILVPYSLLLHCLTSLVLNARHDSSHPSFIAYIGGATSKISPCSKNQGRKGNGEHLRG